MRAIDRQSPAHRRVLRFAVYLLNYEAQSSSQAMQDAACFCCIAFAVRFCLRTKMRWRRA